jgi:hypothetical protein
MAVRLSAVRAGRPPFTPRKIRGTHFCYRLSLPQGHNAAGRIMSTEKSNDLIGNGTHDTPASSMVPLPIICSYLSELDIYGKFFALHGCEWSTSRCGSFTPVPIGQEAGWTLEPVWMLWSKDSCPTWNRAPAVQPVATP